MTKKKTPGSSRTKKTAEFPLLVIQVKEFLKNKNSKKFSLMKKLTESEDIGQAEAFGKMWRSVERADKKTSGAAYDSSDDSWVYYFLEMVFLSLNPPPYRHQNRSDRNALINELQKLSVQLIKKLQKNQLDYRLTYSDGPELKGLYFYEMLDFMGKMKANSTKTEKPTISQILKRMLEFAETEIKQVDTRKAGKHVKEIHFIRSLAQHIKHSSGTPLNAVIATATNAIYGTEYNESDIANLLHR